MMIIECPFCGKRPEHEFNCGGASHIQRPPLDCNDTTWGEYLFFRDNPYGMHFERWRHTFGCGQWFNVVRDTLSHEIKAVYQMTDSKPSLGGENAP